MCQPFKKTCEKLKSGRYCFLAVFQPSILPVYINKHHHDQGKYHNDQGRVFLREFSSQNSRVNIVFPDCGRVKFGKERSKEGVNAGKCRQ